MKLAIMQPYLFPYLPYFQLINAVDRFVNYDDVSFIKKGWINRNNIKSQGSSLLFSVPVSDVSSFRQINKTKINKRLYNVWKKKFFKTIELNYGKAPYYNNCFEILENVLIDSVDDISKLSYESIKQCCNYLKINTFFIDSSEKYQNSHLKGKDRVYDICKQESAEVYINPIGGEALYDKNEFLQQNIQLYFLKSNEFEYKQNSGKFIPNLSIIDVIMNNSVEEISDFLTYYELI